MSQFTRRGQQVWSTYRSAGAHGILQRAMRAGYRRFGADTLEFPLLPGDVADSTRLDLRTPNERPAAGTPLTVGLVTTPPHPRSGGHTTMFRMIEGIERAGHRCVLYLYDRFDGDQASHEAVVRSAWPRVRAEVRSLDGDIEGVDACFATSWQTAHVLARRSASWPCRRLYLVQDFEPYFYPRGSEYALAEDTYRFGFRTVTIGHMAANEVTASAGVPCDVARFGCDTGIYRLTNRGARNGVAFYAKPSVARRGFTLGVLALQEFQRRHPEIEIHVFGVDGVDVPFTATRHGTLSPEGLSGLFNECITGFAMSFTNISLIAEELLACGTIPVVNESPLARADLDNPYALWAPSSPVAMADALCAAVEEPDIPGRAERAAASVRGGWTEAQAAVVRTLESEVYGIDRPDGAADSRAGAR